MVRYVVTSHSFQIGLAKNLLAHSRVDMYSGESTGSGSDDNEMEVGSEQESDQEADSDS